MAINYDAVASMRLGDRIVGTDGHSYRIEHQSRTLGGDTLELSVVREDDNMSMVIHCVRSPRGGVYFQTHKKRPFIGLDMSAIIQKAG